jgi:glycosyltransferase involved in cell wall biosynthesis
MRRLVNPVSILIPTFRRPDSLTRTLRSVLAQDRFDLIEDIAVIDNDPDGSARAAVDALRSSSPAPLLYIHAPPPGVATARNAGVAATRAPLVAFIDDDEEATPAWLGALFQTHQAFQADVTFGPVQGRAPAAAAWKRPYLERFFSRVGPEASGLIETVYGCGNSMMTRATALRGTEPFDVATNHTGGEDDRLFSALSEQGARFAWAADAVVEEHAPEHRARLSYTLARSVSYGQSPSQLALRRGDVLDALKWALIGAGQVVAYGAAALALFLLQRPAWIDMLDKAARGLGKMLWFSRFHFYGEGEARRTSVASVERDGAASFTANAANITQMKSL